MQYTTSPLERLTFNMPMTLFASGGDGRKPLGFEGHFARFRNGIRSKGEFLEK
jgi:hypothetical protein